MTENEALKLGKSLYENITSNANNIIPTKEYIEFVGMAIKALEEIQAYRAIGTVEEIYNMLKVLNRTVSEIHSEVSKYQSIGTVEEFKALKEKSEPKKVLKRGDFYKCPVCNHWVGFRYVYCDGCGQKLDFGKE